MPADVYRPDQGRAATTRWLALILGLAVAFSVCPVVYQAQWNLSTAGGWARIVVLVGAVQSVYIAWMLNRPDWASMWVVMLVFAAVSALYGMASAMALSWPEHEPMPLGMETIRRPARAWCGAVLLTTSLATYLCGRTSAKWRRQFDLDALARKKSRH
ncbi:MAG: hypothetical protein JXB62_00060 [Pirellulales bacterium]|nr:hypothetical protein [Pirellulales bacterium]